MAVLEYKEGEHAAGFIGFRVATTLGSNDTYKQAYFSTKQMSHTKAKKLAFAQDKAWREEAERAIREKLMSKKANSGPGVIVAGLRAGIAISNKHRGDKLYIHFRPIFYVKKPGYGKGEINFPIISLGFSNAYSEAVKAYAKIHSLSKREIEFVSSLEPGTDLFTGPLLKGLRKKGYKLSKRDLLSKLKNIL